MTQCVFVDCRPIISDYQKLIAYRDNNRCPLINIIRIFLHLSCLDKEANSQYYLFYNVIIDYDLF